MNTNQALIDAYRWQRQQHRNSAALRLIERAREDVAADRKRYPHDAQLQHYVGHWQRLDDMRPRASSCDRAYYCDNWPDGLRNLGNVGELRSESSYRGRVVEHTGWYTDECQDSKIAGYVLQLPARNGKPVYVPGTACTGWDGVTLYPLDQYDDLAECARAADRIAEIEAEQERDYQRAWQAGSRAGDLNREAKELRSEIMTVCSDLRSARLSIDQGQLVLNPVIVNRALTTDSFGRLCAIARGKVESLLGDMYKARAERDELRDNYGREAAFVEGYDD